MNENEMMEVKEGMEKEYEEYVKKNQDDYGNCAVVAGAQVGKALTEGKDCKTAHDGMYGCDLTGALAGCTASAIAHFHKRGEEFRIWWNKEHGIDDPKKQGTVNPAIMTIGGDDE